MTTAEHGQRLRRERPNDPEAQGSAKAHEQIAWVIEFPERYPVGWRLGLIIIARRAGPSAAPSGSPASA